MGNVRFVALAAAVFFAALPSAGADDQPIETADSWPFEITERPLTLAPGMLELRGDTLRANLSENALGEPISLAPDVYVGLNRDFTVGVTHDIGICLTPGEGSGCATPYHDVAAEVLYGFMHGGNFQLALRGGIAMPQFSPFVAGLRGGAIARVRGGKVAFVLEPSIYVGVAGRSEESATLDVPTQEVLDVPVAFQVQLQPQTAIFLTSGFRERLADFGDSYEIPVGLGAVFALNHRLDLGGEFRLENVAGPAGGIERRVLILRAALRV